MPATSSIGTITTVLWAGILPRPLKNIQMTITSCIGTIITIPQAPIFSQPLEDI